MDLSNGKLESGIESQGICPKCGGKGIEVEEDIWGRYYNCTYCGYNKEISVRVPKVHEVDLCILGSNEAYGNGR